MSIIEQFRNVHVVACKRSSPSEQILLSISFDCACDMIKEAEGRIVKRICCSVAISHYAKLLKRLGEGRYQNELQHLKYILKEV